MSLQSHLRLCNLVHATLERACRYYSGCTVYETHIDHRYLQLQLVDELNRQATAFFNTDLWLRSMESHLPDIPWQNVPLDYLVGWLNTLQLSFLVDDIIWNVADINIPERPIPTRLLSLVAEPCSILCLDWPVHPAEQSKHDLSLNRLPIQLRYVLGKSQIPLSQLDDLVQGDLLVINQQAYYLAVGQCNLFRFSYHGNDEVIVEQSIFDNQDLDIMEEEHLLDWSKLPVDVEFVLDSNTITLGELNDIGVGSILPVSIDAEQTVRIYLNRKLFALGELVALESGGLAIEVNKINTRPENKKSDPDVE